MHRFLGLEPPKKKEKVDPKVSNQIYDATKRKRKIVPSWKTEFSWLVVNDNDEVMYCRVCRAVYGPLAPDNKQKQTHDKYHKYANGPFVTGCRNLRHDGLCTHETSEGHKLSQQIYTNRNAKPGEAPAEKAIQQLNTKSFDRLNKLFINAHSIAKNSRPVTDFEWICQADEKKGLDIGPTYRNAKSCKEFMVAIAEEVRAGDIEELLKAAKFVTIMSDGSTDVSVVENEIVYVHFCTHGEAHCLFLGLIDCETADAKGIYDAIMRAIKFEDISKDDFVHKIVAFAGDGASVNTGLKNGVIALFRERVRKSIVMVQCLSHRVELAFKEAMKSASLFNKVHDLLDNVYKFYHKSAKQTAGLNKTFEALSKTPVMSVRVGGTRWVGHTHRALTNMIKAYPALILHLSQVAITPSQSSVQSKAKFMLKEFHSLDVMTFAHWLVDVLAVLVQLSMALQTRETCLYTVHQSMAATITNINKLATRPGPEMRRFTAHLQENKDLFEGEKLTGTSNSADTQKPKVIDALVKSMSKRFSDIDSGLLESTKLADLSSWPPTYEEAADFGDEFLATLVDHFRDHLTSCGVVAQNVESEWTILKQELYNSHKPHTMSWSLIHNLYSARCRNILDVMDLIMSLPAGTSECERGFSQMKITKSQYRNKMSSNTITMLMTIQLHSQKVADFDPTRAIHRWNTHHHRRPQFMERRRRRKLPELQVVEEAIEAEAVRKDVVDIAEPTKREECVDSDFESDFSDLEEYSDFD